MHGLGNDFVVIDAVRQKISVNSLPIAQLANRYTGIGFDQLLIIEPSSRANFLMRIFNSDGSEAEQCGNGLRCVARFLHEEGLHAQSNLSIETKSGCYEIQIKDYSAISIVMGVPCFEPAKIPFKAEQEQKNYTIPLANQSITATVLALGNPHALVRVKNLAEKNIDKMGAEMATQAYFPKGTNVGFIEVVDRKHIRLRTIERGAGETHACGSNASAAVVAGIINGWLDNKVRVEYRYGSLEIEWAGAGQPVKMTGPASRVFTGELDATNSNFMT